MDRSWLSRAIAYTLLTIAACVVLMPTVAQWTGKDDSLPAVIRKHLQKKISLGLDLQGGLHLVYEVQVDKAVSDKADRLAGELEDKLHKDKKVKDVHLDRQGVSEIIAKFKNPADAKKLDREFLKNYKRELFEDSRDEAKGEVVLKIDNDYIDEQKDYAVRQGV